MKIHPLLTLSGVIVAVLAPPFASAAPQEIPSPCSYPRLAASTINSNGGGAPITVDMQPTPTPELQRLLRRQMSDSLGWNNPAACNVGVCDIFTSVSCTAFAESELRAETVTGACCAMYVNLFPTMEYYELLKYIIVDSHVHPSACAYHTLVTLSAEWQEWRILMGRRTGSHDILFTSWH